MHLKRIVATLAAATILTAQPCAAAQSTGADSPPSVAVINQRLLDTTQDASLDDAAKAGIRGLYQQALSELEAAASWRVAALDFARRTTDAPAVLAQLEAAVTAPPAAAPSIPATDGLDTLEQTRADVERQLDEAASRLSEADAEPLGRASRRAEIRDALPRLAEGLHGRGRLRAVARPAERQCGSLRGQSATGGGCSRDSFLRTSPS